MTRPTTTEGTAKNVLSSVSTTPRPAKRATPSQAPSTSPRLQASAQAVALTDKERPTIASSSASMLVMSCSAVEALSVKVVKFVEAFVAVAPQRRWSSDHRGVGDVFDLRYRSHRSNYWRYEPPCIGFNSTTPCQETTARRWCATL